MAEVAGLVIGGISLAALFDQCMTIFKLIDSGRQCSNEYKNSALMLTLISVRLSRWERTVRASLDLDLNATDTEGKEARSWLTHIHTRLEEAQKLGERYMVEQTEPSEGVSRTTEKIRSTILPKSDKLSLSKKWRWALVDQEKMKGLVDNLDQFVSSLEKLFPSLQERRIETLRGDVAGLTSVLESGTAGEPLQVVEALKTAANKVDKDLELIISMPPPPPSPPPPLTINLPRLDTKFVDRDDLLGQLYDRGSVKCARIALVGLGGVGKTQIAIRYAQGLQERDQSTQILWIFAAHAARFDESIRDIVDQIRLPGRQDPKADVLQLLQTWLTDTSRRWVIVLDNLDDAAFLNEPSQAADAARAKKRRIDYFPFCNHGKLVITTRSKEEAYKFVDEDDVIKVAPMDADHAERLLQNKLGGQYDKASAARLAEALDFFPLALSQAASFIKQKRNYTIGKYLMEVEKGRKARTNLLRRHGTVPGRDREANSSILLTWQISFEYLRNVRGSAADLLGLMSFCDRQAIPELLLRGAEGDGDADTEDTSDSEEYDESFDEDIEMLENLSFISTTTTAMSTTTTATEANTTTWDMHRLVQDAMQWWLLDHGVAEETKQRFVERLHAAMPTGDFKNWKTCRILLPHVKSAAELEHTERRTSLLWATVMFHSAWYSELGGSLTDAAEFAQKSLTLRRDLLTADHPAITDGEAALADIYNRQGKWKEAEELRVRVLKIRRRVLGVEHPETLTSMGGLASVYRDQGRRKEAEELGMKVLEIEKRVLGEEHPDTLISMSNLALVYSGQGRRKEAEELGIKVLETRRRVLGEEHPSTLISMSNLALVYSGQGRRKEAEELGVRILEIRKRVLGEEHPSTLISMSNLALVYSGQGRWKEAEELGVKILKIRRSVLGEEHPSTLISMSNLASTYRDQGRWKEAEEFGVRVLEIRRSVLGEEHPDTLTSISILGSVYYHQDRLQEASRLIQGCVLSRTTTLGPTHPDTLASIKWLRRIEARMQTGGSD